MSEVQEKSILELMVEEQEKKNKEAEEAKQRKASGSGNFEYEEVEYFSLEDKKEKVCRLLGLPAELRKNSTDFKFMLQSEILKDDKKSYLKVSWPIVERDGKLVPDPDWFLTKVLNKVREGQWIKYEEGRVNETTGKNGEWKKFHTETGVFKRIEGNSKVGELYPKKFYPSIKVVGNVIDRHDSWCKENKHAKLIVSGKNPYTFTDDKGQSQTINYIKYLPKQCYTAITDHFKSCIGIKSLNDIDAVIIKDGKSETSKYVCFDKTDYPKYFGAPRDRVRKSQEIEDKKAKGIALTKDEENFKLTDKELNSELAYKLSSNESLTEEEKAYVLYDIDKRTAVTSYSSLKRHLNGLFKLCDAELQTSFEKELDQLCKEEAANKPAQQNKAEDEERYTSLDDEKPIAETKSEERTRREKKSETSVNNVSILDLCKLNFPAWDKLKETEKQTMIDSIESFKGTVPVYKKGIEDVLCYIKECVFKDSNEPTSYPKTLTTCPVCGDTE
jgi:hypothetical protein